MNRSTIILSSGIALAIVGGGLSIASLASTPAPAKNATVSAALEQGLPAIEQPPPESIGGTSFVALDPIVVAANEALENEEASWLDDPTAELEPDSDLEPEPEPAPVAKASSSKGSTSAATVAAKASIEQRLQRLQRRIRKGFKRGTITRPERRALKGQLEAVRVTMAQLFKGRLTSSETSTLEQLIDALRSSIRAAIRNDDMRVAIVVPATVPVPVAVPVPVDDGFGNKGFGNKNGKKGFGKKNGKKGNGKKGNGKKRNGKKGFGKKAFGKPVPVGPLS